MDQEKIGKFISSLRKGKNLTQEELAHSLNVSNRSVSRWENGQSMPDLSLLEPLSNVLGVSLNELLSGEKLKEEETESSLENNLQKTLNYTNQKIVESHKKLSFLVMAIGILICLATFTIFDKESSWCSIYSLLGIFIFVIGLSRELKMKDNLVKGIISVLIFIILFIIFHFIDLIGVMNFKRPPMYSYLISSGDKFISYQTLFYNVYRVNPNTKNEYYIIDLKKEYTDETIPLSPFNKDVSGIDNIIKYQNKYIGDNSDIGNLLGNLPLSNYGYVFEMDSKNNGLIVHYHMTDWYGNEYRYLEKSLLYNSVAIFLLIENVEFIQYDFSGNSYSIERETVEKKYPNYMDIHDGKKINKNSFNQYVEEKMNDLEFVQETFKLLFLM